MTPYACPQPNKMEGLRKTETCLGYSQTNMSQQYPKLSPQPVEFNLLFSKPKVSLPASVWQCGGANSHSTKSTIISIGKMSKRLYPFAQGIEVTVYLCCLCYVGPLWHTNRAPLHLMWLLENDCHMREEKEKLYMVRGSASADYR